MVRCNCHVVSSLGSNLGQCVGIRGFGSISSFANVTRDGVVPTSSLSEDCVYFPGFSHREYINYKEYFMSYCSNNRRTVGVGSGRGPILCNGGYINYRLYGIIYPINTVDSNGGIDGATLGGR